MLSERGLIVRGELAKSQGRMRVSWDRRTTTQGKHTMRTARDGLKILFSAALISQAVADDGRSCTVSVTPDARMPSRVQAVFKTAGSAIMACRVYPQGVSFSGLSPVVSDPHGVCRFTARRIDGSTVGGDRDGRRHTGTQFMLLAEHGCPDQRDTRYVPTYDTSPEDFRAACTIWRRMTVPTPMS